MSDYAIIGKFTLNNLEFMLLDRQGKNWVSLSKMHQLLRYQNVSTENLSTVLQKRYNIFKSSNGHPLFGRRFITFNDLGHFVKSMPTDSMSGLATRLLQTCISKAVEYEDSILVEDLMEEIVEETIDDMEKETEKNFMSEEDFCEMVKDTVDEVFTSKLEGILKAVKNQDNLFGMLIRIEKKLKSIEEGLEKTNSNMLVVNNNMLETGEDIDANRKTLEVMTENIKTCTNLLLADNEDENTESQPLDIEDVKNVFDVFGIGCSQG